MTDAEISEATTQICASIMAHPLMKNAELSFVLTLRHYVSEDEDLVITAGNMFFDGAAHERVKHMVLGEITQGRYWIKKAQAEQIALEGKSE